MITERPWGTYKVLYQEEKVSVKKIVVKPHCRLSLQSHEHRSEHWIVVHGSGSVVIGEDIIVCSINTQLFIPRGVKHRMCNTGEEELVFIEVQYGNILSEEDIIRYEDDYNRI
jgi:mannose-6-phosphate isomerase-like protein (cupin superfamily)